MADNHETDIATYLTADGQVFIAPQYHVAYDDEAKEGGASPDFVALDFRRREVVVVEVTAAANWRRTFSPNVSTRQTRWFAPIRKRMTELAVIDDTWGIRFLGFVREDNVAKAQVAFASEPDVTIYAIEKATFLWRYWEERLRDGLPRRS